MRGGTLNGLHLEPRTTTTHSGSNMDGVDPWLKIPSQVNPRFMRLTLKANT